MWICYRHRHTLGTFWRGTKATCHYPDHEGVRKRIQRGDVITLHMSKDIQKMFGVIISVELLHTQITRFIKHKVVFIRKTPSTCFFLFFPDTLCGS